LLPTFSLSLFADAVVMTDTISIFGAILIVTSVLTGTMGHQHQLIDRERKSWR